MRFPDSTVVRSAALAGALLLTTAGLTACGASSTDEPAGSSGSSSSASDSVATVTNGASQVAVTMTSENGGTCEVNATSAKAGPVTFTVVNKSASALTEIELQSDNRILGEKENLAPGLPTVKFTVTLGGGAYQIYCPGASTEMTKLTVTGKSAVANGSTATLLADGTKGYATYVDSVVADMQTAVGTLNAAVQAGKLDEAKKDYALARPFYERIESDVDGFVMPGFKATDNAGNLDYLIDMRASNLDPKVGWSGLHAIERDLFLRGKITAQTKTYATDLVKNVGLLDGVVGSLTYKPEDLANGAAGLLEEVQSNKITGEEELYSHIDLVDFAGNVEGAQQAFAYLEPGLDKIDPALAKKIDTQFTTVLALLDTYRDSSVPGGFTYYDPALKAAAAAGLSRAVQSLQEPLSTIAEKVATAQ